MADSRKSPSTELLPSIVVGCLDRHVGERPRLVVALSGGIDSVVLLHLIRSRQLAVEALHVHHGLSANADRWADFCHELCETWNIPLRTVRVEVERASRDGLEGAARRARHDAYEGIAADWILLAHHRGDRAETLLFNLLRGAGVRGAGAMRERSGRLLRPMLQVGRGDIAEYAKLHRLSWVEDDSNADVRYSRNFLRHSILPTIQHRFPAAEQRLASAAARFAEAADLLDDLARLDMGTLEPKFPIPVAHLALLAEPRARNVLRYLLSSYGVGIPSEARLIEVLHQCLSARPDRHPALVFGKYVLRRRAGSIALEPV
jgi:tRNA(Ile)-lysidine synthase